MRTRKIVQLLWETVCLLLKKMKTWPDGSAMPLVGIYLKEAKARTRRGICTPTSTAAIFLTAKMWKEPRCPLKDEQMNALWSVHTMEYHSARKRKLGRLLPHG